MKKRILELLLLVAIPLLAQEVENYVTVYNQNLGLIKHLRTLKVEQAKQTIEFTDVAARLIPSSVHLRSLTDSETFEVLEQNFEYDLISANKILQKYIDHEIEVVLQTEEVFSGTLLSIAGKSLVIRDSQGIKILPFSEDIQISVKDIPEGLITRPTLIWHVKGIKHPTQKLEVSYLTEGINWHAEYVGILNEKEDRLDVAAWVSIQNNSGATYKNALLKLVAGEIHRVPKKKPRYAPQAIRTFAAAKEEAFREKAFFEYHLYTLQRPTTIKQNQIKQITLFPTTTVTCTKQFVYDPRIDRQNVLVKIVFRNKKEAGLGLPLPEGVFRIYKTDNRSLEFIGEDRIEHTPRNEEVSLAIGKAFDLLVERTVVEKEKISRRAERQTIEIEIRNNKEKEDVRVIVVEYLYGTYWKIEESTYPYKKKSANQIEFNIPVKANSQTKLTYKVRYSW